MLTYPLIIKYAPAAGYGKRFMAQWEAGKAKPRFAANTRQLRRQQARLAMKGRRLV